MGAKENKDRVGGKETRENTKTSKTKAESKTNKKGDRERVNLVDGREGKACWFLIRLLFLMSAGRRGARGREVHLQGRTLSTND